MKKYFIFAAIAAAGLLTSCSSSDDAISENPGNPGNLNADRIPIQVSVSSATSVSATRGTGTVGGLVDDVDNIWNAQKINVFMFKKGTMDLALEKDAAGDEIPGTELYKESELVTPAGTSSVASGEAVEYVTDASWEGSDDPYIKHRYYPSTGNYDFWAYHIDDAFNTVNDERVAASGYGANSTKVTVPFTIDGSQDLMVAKAAPDATNDAAAIASLDNDDKNADTKVDADAGREHSTRYYSAFAARRGLQPNLVFQHLLTRLTFTVEGGNKEACGWKDTDGNDVLEAPDALVNAPNPNYYGGIFIKSITIKSKTKGNIIAAYTSAETTVDPADAKTLIAWDDPTEATPLYLKSGEAYDADAAAVNYDAAGAIAHNLTLTGAIASGTALTADQATAVNTALATNYQAGDAINADDANSYNATLQGAVTDGDVHYAAQKKGNKKDLYDLATFETENLWKAALVVGSANYAKIWKPVWVDTPAADFSNLTKVGGDGAALLVSPETEYTMTVVLGQYLLDLEHTVGGQTDKYVVKDIVVPDKTVAIENGFKPGYTYNINIKAFGAEEIVITTTLTAWQNGSGVTVAAE